MFYVIYYIFNFFEAVLVIHRVDRTTQSFDLYQVLQDEVAGVISINFINWIIQGLHVLDCLN